eukprot:5266246-Amphidinium_carterae.1
MVWGNQEGARRQGGEACWPRVRLPTPVVEPDPPLELPVEVLPKVPHEVGRYKHVVECNDFARCLVCYRQTSKVKGKLNYSNLKFAYLVDDL